MCTKRTHFKKLLSYVMCLVMIVTITQVLTVPAFAEVTDYNSGVTAVSPSAVADLASLGFPTYTYYREALPSNLNYNPTGELIFPYIIDASQHIANPLGKYYMYYAPHDKPGGICLAYADSLGGQWTEYPNNPIVSNNWAGNYSVSHVSSPCVIWASQYNKYLMYFHGENTTDRWAYSTDGINWSYGGVCLTTSQFGSNYTEVQYGKVYEYTIPGVGNRYIMLHMIIGNGSGRDIALSISNDGKTFTPYDRKLIDGANCGQADIAGPVLEVRNGRFFVIVNSTDGNMRIIEVGSDFSLERHYGIFYNSLAGYPDKERAAAPFFISDSTNSYMFYESGVRLFTQLAVAKANNINLNYQCEKADTTASGAIATDEKQAEASSGGFSLLHSDGVGDYVEYTVSIPTAGAYDIYAKVKRNNTRGDYRLFLPQANLYIGNTMSQYSASEDYPDQYIGQYTFNTSGAKQLRFIVNGKNASSSGYSLAFDKILLVRK